MLVCNAEVFCIAAQVILVFLIGGFLGSFGIEMCIRDRVYNKLSVNVVFPAST